MTNRMLKGYSDWSFTEMYRTSLPSPASFSRCVKPNCLGTTDVRHQVHVNSSHIAIFSPPWPSISLHSHTKSQLKIPTPTPRAFAIASYPLAKPSYFQGHHELPFPSLPSFPLPSAPSLEAEAEAAAASSSAAFAACRARTCDSSKVISAGTQSAARSQSSQE